MPVMVPMVGAFSGLLKPCVMLPSVKAGAVVVLAVGVMVPGKTPTGLAEVGVPLKLGCVPPDARTLGPMLKLPRVHWKPSARLSSWVISANLALMLICGGA